MEAVNNIEQIAAVPGYQSLFIGPADLGMSMVSVKPEEKAGKIADIQRKVAQLSRQNGKYCGSCAGPTKRSCEELMSRGVQWMTIAQDARILSGALSAAVRDING